MLVSASAKPFKNHFTPFLVAFGSARLRNSVWVLGATGIPTPADRKFHGRFPGRNLRPVEEDGARSIADRHQLRLLSRVFSAIAVPWEVK